MTYSPYGDRDSGGTRTDVDTEVHDDRDPQDRTDDGLGHDAAGHDADGHDAAGHDAAGHDGMAAPFQRDSTDDESVPNAGDTQPPDANADDVAVASTEAGSEEVRDGDVRTDDDRITDVDASGRADGTAEPDSATEQAMAGDDGSTEVPVDAADERPADVADEHDGANPTAGGDRGYADGAADDTAYDDAIAADPTSAHADPTAAYADPYADDTDVDRRAATDGALDSDGPTDAPDGGDPARSVDADYVAVGVAEPMSESEVADIAGPDDSDSFGAVRAAHDGAESLGAESMGAELTGAESMGAESMGAEPADAEPFDAAAEDGSVVDGTAVGMMPGDAPVPDPPARVPNADATHERWQQVQLGFIDDPRGSVESARSLVVEAVEARISALRDRQTALDGWQSEATPDTEVLRAAIQGYRDMLKSLTDTP